VPSLLVQGKRTMSPETATTREEPSKANERNMLTTAAADSSPSHKKKGDVSPICIWQGPAPCPLMRLFEDAPCLDRGKTVVPVPGVLCLSCGLQGAGGQLGLQSSTQTSRLAVESVVCVRHQLSTAESFPICHCIVGTRSASVVPLIVTGQLTGMREIAGDAAAGFKVAAACCRGLQPCTELSESRGRDMWNQGVDTTSMSLSNARCF